MNKKWGCENPKCTNKNVDVVSKLDEESSIIRQYCNENYPKSQVEKKYVALKVNFMKWRCEECLEAFVKREKIEGFFHLVGSPSPFEKRIADEKARDQLLYKAQAQKAKGGLPKDAEIGAEGQNSPDAGNKEMEENHAG